MTLQDTYDLETIRNEAAEMVYRRVEALLECRPEVCRCQTCVLDLVAFVLNRVSPRYSTAMLGDLHPDQARRNKMEVQIDLALEAGLQRLRMHPHHA